MDLSEKLDAVFAALALTSVEVGIFNSRDPQLSEHALNDAPGWIIAIMADASEAIAVAQAMTAAGAEMLMKGRDEATGKDALFYFVKFKGEANGDKQS